MCSIVCVKGDFTVIIKRSRCLILNTCAKYIIVWLVCRTVLVVVFISFTQTVERITSFPYRVSSMSLSCAIALFNRMLQQVFCVVMARLEVQVKIIFVFPRCVADWHSYFKVSFSAVTVNSLGNKTYAIGRRSLSLRRVKQHKHVGFSYLCLLRGHCSSELRSSTPYS
jgi:hypothetical protein